MGDLWRRSSVMLGAILGVLLEEETAEGHGVGVAFGVLVDGVVNAEDLDWRVSDELLPAAADVCLSFLRFVRPAARLFF